MGWTACAIAQLDGDADSPRQAQDLLAAPSKDLPRDWNYQRSRWSSKLMAKVIHCHSRDVIHPSTIRRLHREFGIVYRRACPMLCIKAADKEQKLADVTEALKRRKQSSRCCSSMRRTSTSTHASAPTGCTAGAQKCVPTPGQN